MGKILNTFFGSTGTKVMITTGQPYHSSATKTKEVVDVVSNKTCADLVNFPLANYGAVGANLYGTPVTCGGYSSGIGYSRNCYKFTLGGWQVFASMNEKRIQATGVVNKKKFHVFGGWDAQQGKGRLVTSEIISIDGGVEYGPDLPSAVWQHAITSINTTVSILSGGGTSANECSPLTWYFNHETQAFYTGPSLLEGRWGHGSATYVDKVTKVKLPVVTGGRGNGNCDVILDSTELLINGQWQSGNILIFSSV